jgi:hypothetical protein
MFEFRLYSLPKKMLSNEINAAKTAESLNGLGADGWQVVAAIAEQAQGATTMLVLQRAT